MTRAFRQRFICSVCCYEGTGSRTMKVSLGLARKYPHRFLQSVIFAGLHCQFCHALSERFRILVPPGGLRPGSRWRGAFRRANNVFTIS